MSSMARTFPIDSIASEARPSIEAERLAMLELVGRLDDAKPTQDYPALIGRLSHRGKARVGCVSRARASL